MAVSIVSSSSYQKEENGRIFSNLSSGSLQNLVDNRVSEYLGNNLLVKLGHEKVPFTIIPEPRENGTGRKSSFTGSRISKEEALLVKYKGVITCMVNQYGRFFPREFQTEDLYQTGYIALLYGIRTYDENRGNILFYLSMVVRTAFRSGLRSALGISKAFASARQPVLEIERRLTKQLGRSPTFEELAHEANIPVEHCRLFKRWVSMQPLEERVDYREILENTGAKECYSLPHESEEREERKRGIYETFLKMKDTRRMSILYLRAIKGLHFSEIGDLFDISRQRARELYVNAKNQFKKIYLLGLL